MLPSLPSAREEIEKSMSPGLRFALDGLREEV
jgi:hypothetical protein